MEICDVNKPMDPAGIATALENMKAEAAGPQPEEIRDVAPSPSLGTPSGGGGGIDDLFDDDAPVLEPDQPPPLPRRSVLDNSD